MKRLEEIRDRLARGEEMKRKPKDYVKVNLFKQSDSWQEICFSEMSKQEVLKLKRAVNAYAKYWWGK